MNTKKCAESPEPGLTDGDFIFSPDEDIENADWPKRTNDLFPFGDQPQRDLDRLTRASRRIVKPHR